MTDLNKSELRRLAEASLVNDPEWISGHPDGVLDRYFDPEDAAFIAAANPSAILSLLDEVEELRSLLADGVIDSTALVNFAANRDGLTVGYEGGGCALLAETLGKQLYESQAVNYIEATFESRLHPELGEIVVTLKRETGSTPHQLRLAAEAEVDQLRAEVEALREELGGIQNVSTVTTQALKRLVMHARTSGGTAGPDQGLMDACEQAEKMLSIGGIGRAYMDGADAAMAKEGSANG